MQNKQVSHMWPTVATSVLQQVGAISYDDCWEYAYSYEKKNVAYNCMKMV